MRAEELSGLIPANALLSACTEGELADLLAHASVQAARSGTAIMEQGEEGDSLVILLSGDARVSMVAANGREIILDYVSTGAVLGEIALLDGKPRTATVTAMGPVKMLRLSRPAFQAFVERHPRLSFRMMRAMAQRLRQANDTIESDRAFASGPRLARCIKRLSNGEAERLRLDLSQTELGNFVGISREHVNRQLSAWAEAGVIQLSQGRIRVMDHAYLDEVAESAMH